MQKIPQAPEAFDLPDTFTVHTVHLKRKRGYDR